MKKHKLHIALLLLLTTCLLWSCSTQKNTAKSRFFHAFNTKYNIYYNGSQAFIDGALEKENGNKDNFTEIIPLYTVGNKTSTNLGMANFQRSIEKCEKAIKLHSITRRPVWDKNRRKTERDREWLNRREYNPFLWKVWLLMGRAQFYSGQFDEAISTFSHMSRLYETQPAIYQKARAWLAKTYVEQANMYDAEDVIRNIMRDSLDWRAQKEWDYTLADYYISTANYSKGAEYLRKVIKHEMRRKQKAREWYLLGQLYKEMNKTQQAYKAFKHVVRLNPPYEISFNARIAMTEVMARGQSKKMVSKLRQMAANDNNKNYLDQIYYAMGNIHLAERDTMKAIAAYEMGNKKSARNGIEKGVLLLKLGNIYWEREKFADASRCYNEALGLLNKERKDYEQLSERSKVLDELVPHTNAIELQDSLQSLAKMNEKDRNAAIDRAIAAYKKKIKSEKSENSDFLGNSDFSNNSEHSDFSNNSKKFKVTNLSKTPATWYFYNPMAVSQGKETFMRLWGKRENKDNWQRANKTVVSADLADNNSSNTEPDSINNVSDNETEKLDSARNNPLKREYYLAQIPLTPEQLSASNQLLQDGLFNAGVILKDKLNNLPLSEKAFTRLLRDFPDYTNMADVYYHLYLLYARKGNMTKAETYVDMLKSKHPANQWTKLLTDPYYKENVIRGEHLEDSLYAATYEAFKAGRYDEVRGNAHISETRFKQGENRDKFIFIASLNKLNEGNIKGCVDGMTDLVKSFPESKLSEMAGMIINGVKEGRRIHVGKFDIDDVWQRRQIVLNDSDSIKNISLSAQPDTSFVFMWVYNPDCINENQLLFELARYNFTSYMVRNFNIEKENLGDVHQMRVSGFQNFEEALLYSKQLHQQTAIMNETKKARAFIVSEKNLQLVGQQYSYDDYAKFYEQHFAPLKIKNSDILNEPLEIITNEEEEELPADETSVTTETPELLLKNNQQPKKVELPNNNQQPRKAEPKKAAPKKTEPKKPEPKKTEQNKKPVKQPVKQIDLDDEYYDLEGF